MRLVILQLLVICLTALPALSGTVVTDALLDAVAQIESSGGRFTIGDGGRANGWWQMHEPAWQDTSAVRAQRGARVWEYEAAQNPKVARIYARDYLRLLEKQIRAATKKKPTPEMVYAAYNVGFARLRSLNFDLAKAPSITQASCARLQSLMARQEAGARRSRSG